MVKETKNPPASPTNPGPGGVNTGVAIIGFFLCFLAGVAVMWGYEEHRIRSGEIAADLAGESAGGAFDESDSPIPVSSSDPMWGKRDAPVTIVLFSDFQCPFCARVEPTMQQVKDTYGPDKVRIFWKNSPLPFHQNAKPAAEAAAGVFAMAGNDAFWKWHDTAFKNQQSLGSDSYVRWAQDAGVKDIAAYKAGLDGHKWAGKVDKDDAEGKVAGMQGTPATFVNGVFINGAQVFDSFKKTIDQELQKAQAKIAAGTPRSRIYAEMTRENRKNAPAPATKDEDQGAKEDTTTVFKVPVGSSPVLGSANALVTIILFSDFQCPFCSRVEPTLKAIRDKYGDKVRFVWKNEPLPFHNRAEPCAEAALEVRAEKGDKGFWAMHDTIFANQKAEADDDLVKYATDAGASGDKVRDAIANHTHKREIDADNDLSLDFQAQGTPNFFINGRHLVGARSEEVYDKIIDEEIAKAQALVSKGTRPNELYDALVKDGKGPPPPETKDVPANLPASDPSRGNFRARVTVHEWSDFQCPFCSRVEPVIAQLMKDYGDRIKFVWHDLPLSMHADAPLAAQAGREAFAQKGPAAFWAIHDRMFGNQQHIKRDDLDGYARDLGLDMAKWKAALDGNAHSPEIDADKSAANGEGITGTPAFLVVAGSAKQGYFVSGGPEYGKFRKLIDRALAEAR